MRPLCEALEPRRLLTVQTWISTGADTNWATAANWNHGPIAPGDTLLFNGSDTSATSDNNEAAGNHYSLQFDAGGYDLTGSGIDLADSGGAAILADNPGGNIILDLPLTLSADATAGVMTAGTSMILNGSLSGAAGLTLTTQGPGSLVLSSTAAASGFAGTVDDQGSLQVDSPSGPGLVRIDGGTLAGTGTVGTITATTSGGTLSPGDTTGPGMLSSGPAALGSKVTFAVALDGPGAGQYSQLSASGAVGLAGATLSIDLGYAPASTDSYVIVQDTANAPVQGAFAGLPQGDTVTVDNVQFVINYSGGPAGNEVVLSVNGPPMANPDFYTLPEGDQNFSVPTPGILGNDTDPSGHTLHPILMTTPVHGTLTLNDDGSFSYVPAAGFTGTDSFTYEASDGLNASQPAKVTLVVNPVNAPPQAAPVTLSVVENNPLAVAAPGLLAGSVSPEGLKLTAGVVSGPTHGSVTTPAGDGSFTYTPAAGYTGADSFTFILTDSNGLTSAPATVTLNVQDVPSTVVASSASLAEDGSISIARPGVLINVTNPAQNPLSAVLVNGAADGVVALNADGSFTYTPVANFSGTDSFTFKANDGSLDSNTATVTLHVGAAPVAPTTSDDAFSVLENQTLTVNVPGLLLKDQNPSGGTLSLMVVNGPLHGSFAANTPKDDGSFTYTPNTNFSGNDSFSYYLQANGLTSNVATVSINVAQVPVAPIANKDAYSTKENGTLTVSGPGVLGNDTDPNGGLLTAVLASSPADGSLTLNADGSFTYTPAADFSGNDSFTYQASNGTLLSPPATVAITVTQVAIAPTAAAHSYAVRENQPLAVAAPGLFLGAQNPNGGALSVVVVNQPLHGTYTQGAGNDGSFTYTPATNYSGTDSFTYYLQAGGSSGPISNVATTTITISQVALAPTAGDDTYATDENAALNVAAPGVLGNDIDPNGFSLSSILQTGPAHGSLRLNADGSFTYTPTADYSGADSFTYLAYNGKLESNVATVSLTVVPVVLPPTTSNSSFSMQEDDQLVVPSPGILGGATDPQGLPLRAILVNSTLDGGLSLNPDGSFAYTPRAGFTGTDSFTFRAGDGKLTSNLSTVTIAVSAVPTTTVHLAPGVPDNGGFTDVASPAFVGTTLPGLAVVLYSQAGGAAPTPVAQTFADASGRYAIASPALGDGAYTFWVDAFRPNGLTTGSINAGSLTIDTAPPRISDVFIVPRTGQIMITFQPGISGMNLGSLTDPANYTFSRRATPHPRAFVITSVTLVPPASSTGPVTVALRSSAGKPVPPGHYLFSILSGGITDNAGNRLDGAFGGSFPSGGGGGPGSPFNALFINKNRKPSNPVSTMHFVPILTKHADAVRAPGSAHAIPARADDHARPAGPLLHRRALQEQGHASRLARHEEPGTT